MLAIIQYRGNRVELKYDAECIISRKSFVFKDVLCKRDPKTGKNAPIDFEENLIQIILDMYEINSSQFGKVDSKNAIVVNLMKRLNPTTLIHSQLPEKNRVISKQEVKKKPSKRQTKVVEYDPEYSPNDALNRRLKGSYW